METRKEHWKKRKERHATFQLIATLVLVIPTILFFGFMFIII